MSDAASAIGATPGSTPATAMRMTPPGALPPLPERLARWAIVALVLAAAIPFGSNRPWAWLSLVALVALIYMALAIRDLSNPDAARDSDFVLQRLKGPIVLYLAVAGWVWLQTVPWLPNSWLHPAWRAVGDGVDAAAISVDPDRTAQFGLRLMAYGAIYWIVARLAQDAAFARRALAAFAVFASLLAAYALILAFAGSDTILWYEKWTMHGAATATFVNKNHFATYAGLGMLANMALVAAAIRRSMPGQEAGSRARAAALIATTTGPALVWLIGLLVCATALLATGSRGGFLASLVGAIALALLLARAGRGGIWLLALLLPAGAFLLWNAASPVLDRLFASRPGEELRAELYARILTAIGDAGSLGTGFGGFMEAFRPYKTGALGRYSWDMAHNSYLENTMELGWPAAAALMLALLWISARCLRGLSERGRRRHYPALGVAATLLVGLHATVDFSMQIPAIPAAYALLMGIAWAQSWPTRAL